MQSNLPLHPTKRHPHTGEPLRAIFVRRDGRVFWPILGASEDDGGDADKDKGADADKADNTGDKDKSADTGGDTGDKDLGFPKDTPVADMKPAEQAAYWKHQSRKHEDRNNEWQKTLGGKTAAEIAAEREELTKLRTEKMSDSEKAIAEAKTEGRREASLAIAPQMFDVALSHVDEDRRKVLIDSLDLAKVIKEDGTVDTAKVTSIAATLAPAKGGQSDDPDYGNGKRTTRTSSGVGAGRDAYEAEKTGKK